MTAVVGFLLAGALLLATSSPRVRPPPRRAVLVGGVVLVGGAVALGVRIPVGLLVLLVVAVLAAAARQRRVRLDAEESRRRAAVIDLCEGLAADVRAGLPPASALAAAVVSWQELAPVLAAAHVEADVAEGFRRVATRPGAESLRWVAAAWDVSSRSGSALAATLDRIARAVVTEHDTVRVVAAELASARATSRLLLVLPVGVLLLGRGIGGDPFGFLLASPVGLACLLAGLGLVAAGTAWTESIAARVRRC